MDKNIWLSPILAVIALGIFGYLLHRHFKKKERHAQRLIEEAQHQKEELIREADAVKKAAILEAKDEAYRMRSEIERENREKRNEIQRLERRLAQKEENLDRRLDNLEKKERTITHREQEVTRLKEEAQTLATRQREELQRISGLSNEDARKILLKQVEDEIRYDAARMIRDVEAQAREEAEMRARKIVAMAIQRCAVDQVSETTVSVVPLPGDEMKGRIIGREGRNIRTFETLTGVDLIIDDTPEAVVLSSFDPIRREVARIALTSLITDGRIHPTRIEEAINRARQEVETVIRQSGERAVFETGVTGLDPEIVRLLGKLKYRTSFGQNILDHSIEVGLLAGLMAGEMRLNAALAKRAGLLHDIGKAVDFEMDGTHTSIGLDILRRCKESREVINAVAAHHEDEEPTTIEAVLVQSADAISSARPGARREMLETYVKRVQKLEEVGDSFQGVEKTYAVQAGREIRVIVRPKDIDDIMAVKLAHDMAKRIEEEMEYPGQIKVTVIRETRAVEYAK
ncbi:MAG: ribonuclease Y [Armatimonadetes bacterium]|nr:ribonuclease Y [Armatimonadota bacterium]